MVRVRRSRTPLPRINRHRLGRLAEKIERKRHHELEAAHGGIDVTPVRPVLFSVATTEWLDLKQPGWSDKMYTISKTDVGHLKKSFAKLLVTDISGRDIADYIVERRQQKAAEKTIRNELGTLRGILKKHKRWGAIKDDVRLPKGREDIGH